MYDPLIFLLFLIIIPLIWYAAIKFEEIISIKTREKFKEEKIESGERSIGNPLSIGFEYYIFASLGLIIEAAVVILLLNKGFLYYSIMAIFAVIVLSVIWKMKY